MEIAGALVIVGWCGLGLTLLLAAAMWLWRRRRILAIGIGFALVASTSVSAYALWYRYRPKPTEQERELMPGIRYRVISRTEPIPTVAHVAIVDLTRVEIITSAPNDDGSISAATVSDFAESTGAHVAINAHFFQPFESNGPLDYYPHLGDPVYPIGIAAADGVDYTKQKWRNAVVYFSVEGVPSLGEPEGDVHDAVAGRYVLVRDGVAQMRVGGIGVEPRTALGFDDARETLYLLVIDGRQPGYSLGATLQQVGQIMVELGAHTAIELDGGGSSTMVANIDDDVDVLNSPIHTRIPGRQRPVATKLGVRVHP